MLERTGKRLLLRTDSTLTRGAYRVRWHTVSTEDGHALEGEFSFGVRAAAGGSEHALEQSPLARGGWLRIALRLLLYVALLPFAAAILLPVLQRRERPSWLAPSRFASAWPEQAHAAVERERRVTGDLAWLSVGAAAGVTLADAADAAGRMSAAGLRDFLFTGSSGPARIALVLALLLAALLAGRSQRISAVAITVALMGLAASGHAASASPRAPSIVNDWLHLLSGAVWLGGIAMLVLVWWPALRSGAGELRTSLAREVLPAFGRVAVPAFVLAVSTGAVSLLVQLGHLDALWNTAYGRVLLVKIVVVGCVAAVSFTHARRLRPRLMAGAQSVVERRHWQLLRSEPLVGIGVVGAVAALVAFPLPPRQLADTDEAVAARPACDPCPLPRPAGDELAVAERAGSHVVAGWLRRDSRAGSRGRCGYSTGAVGRIARRCKYRTGARPAAVRAACASVRAKLEARHGSAGLEAELEATDGTGAPQTATGELAEVRQLRA